MSKSKPIPGGSFLIARKIFNSGVWLKSPIYVKVWLWILGQAGYADREKNNQTYGRGEFVTTYDQVIKAASYYHNRKHIVPTLKQIRVMLDWFQSQEMIIVEPIRASEMDQAQIQTGFGVQGKSFANPHQTERPTRADPRARTRAYVGIKIVVVNYGTYQDLESYKGRDKGRPSVQQGHNTNKGIRKNTSSAKKAKRTKSDPDVKRFIDWWVTNFEKKFGCKYTVNGGKDGNTVKRLLSTDSYEDLIKLAEKFFHAQDSFIKDAGYTIGVFSSQINKLKSQGPQRHDRYAT